LLDAWTAAEQLRSASQIIRSICRAAEIEGEISPIRPAHALPFAPGPNEPLCPSAATVPRPGKVRTVPRRDWPFRATATPTYARRAGRVPRCLFRVCGEAGEKRVENGAAAQAKEKSVKRVQRQGSDLAYQGSAVRLGSATSRAIHFLLWLLYLLHLGRASGSRLLGRSSVFWADLVSRRSRSSRVAGEHEKDAAAGRDGEPGFRRRRYPGFRSSSVCTGDGAVHDSPNF
jgi:hypothetical protein